MLIGNQLDPLSRYLNLYSWTYQEVIILGDFNADVEEKHMKCFFDNLKSFIKQPTCCKNPDSSTCIDLFLTKVPRSFQSTFTFMRKSFKNLQPKIINYRSNKNFSNRKFKSCLLNKLRKEDFVNNDEGFEII